MDGYRFVGTLLYSLDHGDPYPIGIPPDSQEEIRAAWQYDPIGNPGEFTTKTAVGFSPVLPLTQA